MRVSFHVIALAVCFVAFSTSLQSQEIASLHSQRIAMSPQLVLDAKGFSDPVHRLGISNDGRWLAAAAEKVVRVWDVEGGRLHATLRGYQEPLGYHVGFIDSLTFSPDSRFLIVGVSDNFAAGSTRVYDLEDPKRLKSLVKGHLGCTRGVCFSPSGSLFATWGCDGNIIVYDWDPEAVTATERFRINWDEFHEGRAGQLNCFQFTEDGEYLVFSQRCADALAINVGTRRVAFLDSPEVPKYLSTYGLEYGASLQRRSESEVSGSVDPVVRIGTRQDLKDAPWAISGETRRGPKGTDFVAALWTNSGEPVGTHRHRYHVSSVALNERAGLAASADVLGNIHVWNPSTGKLATPVVQSENKSIWSVFWSESGTRSLEFSTTNLPAGKFHYNNYGAIDSVLDLDKMVVKARVGDGKRRQTSLRTREFELHRRGALGKTNLVVSDAGGERLVVPVNERREQLSNPAVRIPLTFGEITLFMRLSYPSGDENEKFLLGSKLGGLCEGYFEMSGSGREFRVTKRYVGHSSRITGADISPDGRFLATSSLDGTIRIWPLVRPRVLGDVDFQADGTKIEWIPEESNSARSGLAVGDVVQFVGGTTFYQRIPEIQRGKLLPGQVVDVVVTRRYEEDDESRQMTFPVKLAATPDVVEPFVGFFLARDGEWVIWNDAGYYDSSTNGAQYLGWHVNNARNEPASFYTSDQFQQALYQPAVLRESLRRGSASAAAFAVLGDAAVSNTQGLAVPLASESEAMRYVPPEVAIVTPARNSLIQRSHVSIRTRVRIPKDVDVREARIFIDGRPHPTALPVVKTGIIGDSREFWFEEEFDLERGSHQCKVTVETSVSTSATAQVQFEVQGRGEAKQDDTAKGRLFVLAIGISDYLDPDLCLDFPHRDAEEFTALWEDRGRRVFTEVRTRLLVNGDATVRALKEDGIGWLLNQDLGPEDTVVVFLAGHGFFDRFDEWHFGGVELDLGRLSTTGISDAELSSFFKKVPANTIMFIDSCHSGQFVMPGQVSKMSRTGKNLWRGEGKIVFSSCLPGESSWESDRWKHGAFTKAVLNYFSKPEADYNGDGELGCLEMIQYVQDRVREMTDERQNPSVEFPSGISDVSFGPMKVTE